jgi:hypothetical protein
VNRFLTTVGCCLLLLLASCSPKGPRVVRVQGVATSQGKPIVNVLLNFSPVQGRPSNAFTDEQGKFDVDYSRDARGLLISDYRVWLEHPYLQMQREGMVPMDQPTPDEAILAICKKYGSPETGLKITITEATYNLELKFD